MESKLMKSELLYIEEHLSCQNYMTTIETGFKYLEFDKNTEFIIRKSKCSRVSKRKVHFTKRSV